MLLLPVREAAKIVGISKSTLRTRTRDFSDYLSEHATPPMRGTREYTSHDIQILLTVETLKSKGYGYNEIKASLDAGDLAPMPNMSKYDDFEPQTQEPAGNIITRLTATLSRYEGELSATKNSLDKAYSDLESERQARIEAERDAVQYRTRAEMLRDQLDELNQDKFVRYDPNQYGQETKKRWWEFWKD